MARESRGTTNHQKNGRDAGACRTVAEVHQEWCRRSGERITRQRVWQILHSAERKIERALRKAV